jgi:hypothetical protein
LQTDIEQQVADYCDWLVAETGAELRPTTRDAAAAASAQSRVWSRVAMIAAAALLVVGAGVVLANRDGVRTPDTPPTLGTLPPTATTLSSDQATMPSESVTTTPDTEPVDTAPTTTPSSATWTDADSYPSNYGMGCCGANATGSPSPALTGSPAPLADGTYAMETVGWTADDPSRVQVSLRSLVPCADGVDSCSPLADGTYGPDEVGYSADARSMDVTLDDSVTVYLAGDDIDAESATRGSTLRTTDGTGLADLMLALANAYETEIGGPLRAGIPVNFIAADLQANPRSGFTSAAELFTGELYFSFRDAPPVLFQALAQQGEPLPRSGTSVLIPRTLTIEQGVTTLELYAGFRS